MNIAILCSDLSHPIVPYLSKWKEENKKSHLITITNNKDYLTGGDILFLISCSEIVGKSIRENYKSTLVIHASDLPQGRGWSPHVWEIITGAEVIIISVIEADDMLDTGKIFAKIRKNIEKHLLWNEINNIIFCAEIELMNYIIKNYDSLCPEEQDLTKPPTYYRRRKPEDSRINPLMSIESQFDIIRVSDPYRFPAFFELHGCKYNIYLEKAGDVNTK